MNKEKIKNTIKTVVGFILNPRLILCFGIGWMITNGWSYVLFGIGTFCKINWMVAVSSAYLALLWIPFTPEKIITFAIAILLMKWLFPKDEKTLGMLHRMHESAKQQFRDWNNKRKDKKNSRQ